jgi:hypothetical protein
MIYARAGDTKCCRSHAGGALQPAWSPAFERSLIRVCYGRVRYVRAALATCDDVASRAAVRDGAGGYAGPRWVAMLGGENDTDRPLTGLPLHR